MADDDDQWRFSIDDVGPDDEEEAGTPETGGEGDSDESDAWGTTVDEDDDWGTTVGEDDDGPTVALGAAAEEGSEEGGNVAGTLAPDVAVEPGMPDFENVVFATVGAIFTAIVLAGLVTPLDISTVATIAGGIGLGAGLLYALFRRF